MNVRWQVLSGVAAGVAHLRNGQDCEDAFAIEQSDGVFSAAVCDGSSGAPLSAIGARLAAELALGAVRDGLRAHAGPPTRGPDWHGFLSTTLGTVVRRYSRAAGQVARLANGRDAGDLDTTLTLVVANPPWLAVLAVGDGFVVTRSGDGTLDLLLAPDPDSPDAGVTTFLTSTTAIEAAHCLVARIDDLTGVAVSTDGLADVALEFDGSTPRRPIAGFFGPVFDWASDPDVDDARLSQLLVSQRVCAVTEDDK